MTVDNEQQLVNAVLEGDQHALGQLLEMMQPRLYNVCLRMVSNRDDAAEVTQEAMLKIIEHVQDFKGQSRISTWMIRIAMNLSISHLRKRQVRQAGSLEQPTGNHHSSYGGDQSTTLRLQIQDDREPEPSQSVQQKEMLALLQTAVGQLPEEFRSVIVLRDIEEMDYQQMADVLAAPVGTVKSRLFRARLALRQQMLALSPPSRHAVEPASTSQAAVPPREVSRG
jgi:RNA polymerase sigma-70 factor (ECF subfamily)